MGLIALTFSCTSTESSYPLDQAYKYETFSSVSGSYIIGSSDTLDIKVVGQPDLSGTYIVSPSGFISFPLIGYVKSAGFTQKVLADRIRKMLTPYLKNPSISLSVTEYNSYKVFITGEVNAPGQYTYSKKTSILQGLIVAGGLTKFATGTIKVVRKNKKGQTRRYEAEYQEILNGEKNLDQFLLQRGDVINVD